MKRLIRWLEDTFACRPPAWHRKRKWYGIMEDAWLSADEGLSPYLKGDFLESPVVNKEGAWELLDEYCKAHPPRNALERIALDCALHRVIFGYDMPEDEVKQRIDEAANDPEVQRLMGLCVKGALAGKEFRWPPDEEGGGTMTIPDVNMRLRSPGNSWLLAWHEGYYMGTRTGIGGTFTYPPHWKGLDLVAWLKGHARGAQGRVRGLCLRHSADRPSR